MKEINDEFESMFYDCYVNKVWPNVASQCLNEIWSQLKFNFGNNDIETNFRL